MKITKAFFYGLSTLLPLCSFLVGYYGFQAIKTDKIITTPHLIGKKLHDALTNTSEHHLNIRLISEKEDAVIPEGTILHQIPHPGKKIRPNQNIFVTLAKKPAHYLIPNLLKKTEEEISIIAKKDNLKIKKIFIPSSYQTKNSIAQSPLPEQPTTTKNINVFITNQCNPLFIVPNFKGQALIIVEDLLKKMNIVYQIFDKQQESPSQINNFANIIDQKPMAGSIVKLNKQLHFQLQVDI